MADSVGLTNGTVQKEAVNACPFCNAHLSGDPLVCPKCKNTLRLPGQWWDLSSRSGVRVLGNALFGVSLLAFALYSLHNYIQPGQPTERQHYLVGMVVCFAGAFVFGAIAFRAYRAG